jgi:hypothetical protein
MYKNNGEYWYEAPPLYKRIRKWFLWIGGWEKSNSEGWHFRYDHGEWRSPTPMSFLGHKITIQHFGIYFRLPSGHLHIGWSKNQGRKCYISPDGTPQNAHTWFWGLPKDILNSSRKRGESLKEFERRIKVQ